MNWFNRLFSPKEQSQDSVELAIEEFKQQQAEIHAAGSTDGVHYTDTVETIKQLKREGRHSEVIQLLLSSIEAVEREARVAGEGWGVAPWYYEQLAIIYRKERRYVDEVAVLERYQAQAKAPGVGPTKLKDRLIAADVLPEN